MAYEGPSETSHGGSEGGVAPRKEGNESSPLSNLYPSSPGDSPAADTLVKDLGAFVRRNCVRGIDGTKSDTRVINPVAVSGIP
jgi:hypothetical protein